MGMSNPQMEALSSHWPIKDRSTMGCLSFKHPTRVTTVQASSLKHVWDCQTWSLATSLRCCRQRKWFIVVFDQQWSWQGGYDWTQERARQAESKDWCFFRLHYWHSPHYSGLLSPWRGKRIITESYKIFSHPAPSTMVWRRITAVTRLYFLNNLANGVLNMCLPMFPSTRPISQFRFRISPSYWELTFFTRIHPPTHVIGVNHLLGKEPEGNEVRLHSMLIQNNGVWMTLHRL